MILLSSKWKMCQLIEFFTELTRGYLQANNNHVHLLDSLHTHKYNYGSCSYSKKHTMSNCYAVTVAVKNQLSNKMFKLSQTTVSRVLQV
jgi:hypothetical protein